MFSKFDTTFFNHLLDKLGEMQLSLVYRMTEALTAIDNMSINGLCRNVKKNLLLDNIESC